MDFTPNELESIRFRNGRFSFNKFKGMLRKKVRRLLWVAYGGQFGRLRIDRIAIRGIDPDVPKDFFVDVSLMIVERDRGTAVIRKKERRRQTFRYVLEKPGERLRGELVLQESHYEKL